MSRLSRRLVAILTIPLVLILSSCIRMTADYDIVSEDEIKLVANIGVQNSFADQMGSELPSLCDQGDFDDVEGATAEEYTEEGPEGYTGCEISGTATLADMGGDGTSITLVDDVWTFSMDGEESNEEMSADMFTDFRVSVTFPGKVLSHSGTSTVEGTTVTWANAADMFTADGLTATAENGAGGGLTWLWILLGVLALAAIGAAIYVLTRRRAKPTDGAPYAGPGPQYPPYPQGQPYPPQGGPTAPSQPYPPQAGPTGPAGQPYPPHAPGRPYPQGSQTSSYPQVRPTPSLPPQGAPTPPLPPQGPPMQPPANPTQPNRQGPTGSAPEHREGRPPLS